MLFFVGSDVPTHPSTLASALCIIAFNLCTSKALEKYFMLNSVLIWENISAFTYDTMNK